jgi:tetratricopeptide (TPR) repeat protein
VPPHRALLVLALQWCALLAAAKKRKQPAVPAELLSGCPFHREQASPDELSEFGHELERDGRKPEAERCYARAIRSSPQAATGWFDLAAAHQYSDQSAAIRYYRHGLKLRPSGAAPQLPASRTLLRTNQHAPSTLVQVFSTTSSAWSCARWRGGRASAREPGSATAHRHRHCHRLTATATAPRPRVVSPSGRWRAPGEAN